MVDFGFLYKKMRLYEGIFGVFQVELCLQLYQLQ